MKKIILTVFAALMALTVFTGCEYKVTKLEPTFAEINEIKGSDVDKDNGKYKAEVTFLDSSNFYIPKKGDVFKFVIEGIPDCDVSEVKVCLGDYAVDSKEYTIGEECKLLSKDETIKNFKLTKDKDNRIEFEITLTEPSSSYDPKACKLRLSYTKTAVELKANKNAPVIKVNSFKVSVEQK